MDPNSILRRCTSCKSRLTAADDVCPICGESVESGLQPLRISAAHPAQLPTVLPSVAQPIEEVRWAMPTLAHELFAPGIEPIEPIEPAEPVTGWARILASISRLLRRHWQLVGLFVASIIMVLAGGYLISWGMNVRSNPSVRQNVAIVRPASTETGSPYGIGGQITLP